MNLEFQKLIKKIPNKKLRILDLGCGRPTEIFKFLINNYLHADFHYTGVDANDEFLIYHIQPEQYLPERYEYFPNELLLSLFNRTLSNTEDTITKTFDMDWFRRKFNFQLNTDVIEYITTIPIAENYDVIILKNILHKLSPPNDKTVFDKCISLLSQEGLIYVSVLRKDYTFAENNDNLYNMDRYNTLIKQANIIWDDRQSNYHYTSICNRRTMLN
jgi:chemotaxis methyl-accepting protein methylase